MNYELRTKKGFTLVELLVAVSLLAMMIAFASMIFNVSIDSHRTAVANAEIMQKLRAITDQINADFKGFMWKPTARVGFTTDVATVDGKNVDLRADRIVFFANGDFQSVRAAYGTSKNEPIVGNVARIFYGQSENPNPINGTPRGKILIRRQMILIPNSDLSSPPPPVTSYKDLDAEYYEMPLAEWQADPPELLDPLNPWNERPDLDSNNNIEQDVVKYMAKGVDNFTIQYVGQDDKNRKFNEWRPETEELKNKPDDWDKGNFKPVAFKFTFTLYDSKGLIKDGREFTHIVYLGN